MKCMFLFLLLFFVYFPLVSSIDLDTVEDMINEDPNLYDIYHDNPEALLVLFEERPYLLTYYKKHKDDQGYGHTSPSIVDSDFVEKVLIRAIKEDRLVITLKPATLPPSLRNQRINIKIGIDVIGVVTENGKITTLQYGPLDDHTVDIAFTLQGFVSFLNGDFELDTELATKDIQVTTVTGEALEGFSLSASELAQNLVGKAIFASPKDGDVPLLHWIIGIGAVVGTVWLFFKKQKVLS